MNVKLQLRLMAALTLAQDEIHHPGAAASRGIDLDKMIETILAEAKAAKPVIAEVIAEQFSRAG